MLPPAILHKDRLLLPNVIITKSETISPKTYLVGTKGLDPKRAAITIRGNGITIDFQGAVLRGSPATTEPDARDGVGLRIEGKDVTIKNAKIHGYKVALYLDDALARELLVLGHAHGVGERSEDLRRRMHVAALLEADEVVDADAGERGDLLAPQTRRPPSS